MKFKNSSIIQTPLGTYQRALETPSHIYFINYTEEDENASVKMFDRKLVVISDNIHAYNSFYEDIQKGIYSWMSPKLLKVIQGTKYYKVMYNIGKAKYVVRYHNGIKKHEDKSPFYDISIFKNKIKLKEFTDSLLVEGYVEK